VPDIDVWIDYMCPYCGQFETANGEQIAQWAEAGEVDLVLHPIAILDRLSQGTAYSTRAANAMACVADADPESVLAFNQLLFERQPEENSEGLSDDELLRAIADAGVTADLTSCVEDQELSDQVAQATTDATSGASIPEGAEITAVQSTPTVLVDGVEYTAWLQQQGESLTSASAFATFAEQNGVAVG
jgi:protein-disulfide isomerase